MNRLNGDNNYFFAKWYVGVLIFETIDRIGNLSTLFHFNILWIFAVPWYRPYEEPVGYKRKNSCYVNLTLIFIVL